MVLSADEFVPLAIFLRPAEDPVVSTPPRDPKGIDAGPSSLQCAQTSEELAETLAAVRCFRAALADALDVAVQNLLPNIARDVVGRELRIEPADLVAIVTGVVERFGREQVLAIRIRSDEISALTSLGVEVVADDRLSRGDAAIELHSGTINMTLGTRLDALLADGAR